MLMKASELYALADKCARIEEGRRLPREALPEKEVVDKRKNRRHLLKRVFAAEADPEALKKARTAFAAFD